jgi:hypothetical protein
MLCNELEFGGTCFLSAIKLTISVTSKDQWKSERFVLTTETNYIAFGSYK